MPSKKLKAAQMRRRAQKQEDDAADQHIWDEFYAQLIEYGNIHEDYNVPPNYSVRADDERLLKLGLWLQRQGQELHKMERSHPQRYMDIIELVETGKLWFDNEADTTKNNTNNADDVSVTTNSVVVSPHPNHEPNINCANKKARIEPILRTQECTTNLCNKAEYVDDVGFYDDTLNHNSSSLSCAVGTAVQQAAIEKPAPSLETVTMTQPPSRFVSVSTAKLLALYKAKNTSTTIAPAAASSMQPFSPNIGTAESDANSSGIKTKNYQSPNSVKHLENPKTPSGGIRRPELFGPNKAAGLPSRRTLWRDPEPSIVAALPTPRCHEGNPLLSSILNLTSVSPSVTAEDPTDQRTDQPDTVTALPFDPTTVTGVTHPLSDRTPVAGATHHHPSDPTLVANATHHLPSGPTADDSHPPQPTLKLSHAVLHSSSFSSNIALSSATGRLQEEPPQRRYTDAAVAATKRRSIKDCKLSASICLEDDSEDDDFHLSTLNQEHFQDEGKTAGTPPGSQESLPCTQDHMNEQEDEDSIVVVSGRRGRQTMLLADSQSQPQSQPLSQDPDPGMVSQSLPQSEAHAPAKETVSDLQAVTHVLERPAKVTPEVPTTTSSSPSSAVNYLGRALQPETAVENSLSVLCQDKVSGPTEIIDLSDTASTAISVAIDPQQDVPIVKEEYIAIHSTGTAPEFVAFAYTRDNEPHRPMLGIGMVCNSASDRDAPSLFLMVMVPCDKDLVHTEYNPDFQEVISISSKVILARGLAFENGARSGHFNAESQRKLTEVLDMYKNIAADPKFV